MAGRERIDREGLVREHLEHGVEERRALAADPSQVLAAADAVVRALAAGKRVLLCGNGGSAADAQHIAAELTGRYRVERRGLPALALTANTSDLTAIGNDYGYDRVFERLVEAHLAEGDVLLAISTSGASLNVVRAARAARRMGGVVVALTGAGGGVLADEANVAVKVPSEVTARIQELHITVGHLICDVVEQELFGKERTATEREI